MLAPFLLWFVPLPLSNTYWIINKAKVPYELTPMARSRRTNILSIPPLLYYYIMVTFNVSFSYRFFISRENDILLSPSLLFITSISSCIFSYLLALSFYLIVERPFKNFLDLVLFPRRKIFIKQKDIDNDTSEEEENEQEMTKESLKT